MNKRSTIVVLLTVIAALLALNIAVMGSRSAEAHGAKGAGEPYVVKWLPAGDQEYYRVWSDGQIDFWVRREPQQCGYDLQRILTGPSGHTASVVDADIVNGGFTVAYADGRVDHGNEALVCTISGDGSAPFCLGDVDRNGETDFDDLLFVLTDWGPCQE